MRIAVLALLASLAPLACDLDDDEDDDDEGGADFGATPPTGTPGDAACSSGEFWQRGDEESSRMHPGVDCVGCHVARGEGPRFALAGTVMADFRDADDCRGVEGVTVEITDSAGTVFTLDTNSAGNFYLDRNDGPIVPPYTARLTNGAAESAMVTPQTETSCLVCHTVEGRQDAPGRIVAP